MLQIDLFGGFAAQRDGAPLRDLRLNSADRLLALLVLHPDRALRNTWIAETLWPGTGSLDSLRQSIVQLRKALGGDSSGSEKWRLKTENNTVSFDTHDVEADVCAFDAAVKKGDLSSLKIAVKLYRGPLLKDWDEPCVRPEREERRERYLDALSTLAEDAFQAARFTEAARYLAKLVDTRPKLESGWERLIESLIKGGARVEALDIYPLYRAHLKRAGQQRGVVLEPSQRVEAMIRQIQEPPTPVPPELMPDFAGYEPVGGAVPLNSPYYVLRPEDEEVHTALRRQESIVLIKGPRQIGKTSLLARALHRARENGARVILTDWQKLAPEDLESAEAFFRTLAQAFADQLNLDIVPADGFPPNRAPSASFERFLRNSMFAAIEGPLVWGIDEADRVFPCPFRDTVFGLFRSWHNERAYDPAGPWNRFTLALAYATDAHLFIRDLNQSPFNVGTRVTLPDLTLEQVSDLNRRYGGPLQAEAEVARLFDLVGGHPYLVRRSLHEMKKRRLTIADVEAEVVRDDGIFGDYLNRMLVALLTDPDLAESARNVLRGEPCPTRESLARLCASGVLVGGAPSEMRPRCRLYDLFLRRHLL